MAVVVVVRDIVVYTLDVVSGGPNPVDRIFEKTPPGEFS